MKIALFKSISCGYHSIWNLRDGKEIDTYVPTEDYVRVSEWIDVEFPPRDQREYAATMIAALDQRERELVEQFQQKLAKIRDQKQQLLAIEHVPSQPDAEAAARH